MHSRVDSPLSVHLCRRLAMRRPPASTLGDAADGTAVPPVPHASGGAPPPLAGVKKNLRGPVGPSKLHPSGLTSVNRQCKSINAYYPSGTGSSPRESGLPAHSGRYSPVWRPLLLGAWVEASGSSESGTPPETGINMTRSSTAKKSAGTLLIPVVGLYRTAAAAHY